MTIVAAVEGLLAFAGLSSAGKASMGDLGELGGEEEADWFAESVSIESSYLPLLVAEGGADASSSGVDLEPDPQKPNQRLTATANKKEAIPCH